MATGTIPKNHGLQIKIVHTDVKPSNQSVGGQNGFTQAFSVPNQTGYTFVAHTGVCGTGIVGMIPLFDGQYTMKTQSSYLYVYNSKTSSQSISNNYTITVQSLFVKQD